MQGVLFILAAFYIGFVVNLFVFGEEHRQLVFPASFLTGSVVSVSTVAPLMIFLSSLDLALTSFCLIFLIFIAFTFKDFKKGVKSEGYKNYLLFTVLFFVFYVLFEKSFSYNHAGSNFLIQSNLYQDFGAHIPFIRYFSEGNIIPEVPFFAGKGIYYHYMLDFYVGILERLGLMINAALNVVSSLYSASLLVLLYYFGKKLFKSSAVGYLACVFLFFAGGLSFINVISYYGISSNIFSVLYHHNVYLDGLILGGVINNQFLSINVFLNQRHLFFSIGVLMLILYILLFNSAKQLALKQIIFSGLLIGLLTLWNVPVLFSIYILLVILSLFFPEKRSAILKIIGISLLLSLPQLLLVKMNSVNQILFRPGFLLWENLSIKSALVFWVWNLGFLIPVVVFGFIKSNLFQRKVFIAFLSLFIIANLFQFSPSMFDNHKFFNIWMLSICIFAAYGIVILFNKGHFARFLAVVLAFAVMTSGLFNMLVVKNDLYTEISDSRASEFGTWISRNIPRDEIILTNGEIYDPATLAGRRVFLTRAHYLFLYGGNPQERIAEKELILEGKSKGKINKILTKENINYIIIYKEGFAPNLHPVNNNFFNEEYIKIYEDNSAVIYKI